MDTNKRLAIYRHDLRNHLSVIKLYTELLSQHLMILGEDDRKAKGYIETILRRTVELEKEFKKLSPEEFSSLLGDEAYTQNPELKQ